RCTPSTSDCTKSCILLSSAVRASRSSMEVEINRANDVLIRSAFFSMGLSLLAGSCFRRLLSSSSAESGRMVFCSVEGAVTSLMRYSPVEIKDSIYMFVNNPLKMRPYAQRQREFVSGEWPTHTIDAYFQAGI